MTLQSKMLTPHLKNRKHDNYSCKTKFQDQISKKHTQMKPLSNKKNGLIRIVALKNTSYGSFQTKNTEIP